MKKIYFSLIAISLSTIALCQNFTEPLTVETNSDAVLSFNNTDDSWQYFQFKRSGVRKTWMGLSNGNDFRINKEEGGNILLTGGNVGIGTTTPSQKLDINGRIIVSKPYDAIGFETNGLMLRNSTQMDNTSVNGISFATSTVANYGYSINTIRTSNGQGSFNIKYHNNSVSGDSRFFIDQNGKVGIGTASPSQKLDINGRIVVSKPFDAIGFETNGLMLRNSTQMDNTSVNGISFATSTVANYGYSINTIRTSNGQGSFNIKYHNNSVSGDSRFFIDQNGKVGIGTTSTGTHKLAVEGTIGAREIKVEASGWSDFVFESHYKLRTLEEVEKHISEKGHLPEIPSEDEVIENGINLGEMDAKLLQKIEELTLYLIEQNKRLESQSETISELQKEVSALKNE